MRTTILLALLLAAAPLAAQQPVPMIMSHSGRLVDGSDAPVQGEVTLVFKLRKLSAPPPVGSGLSDEELWTDTFTKTLQNGVYQVDLGSKTPLPAAAFEGERFLEITVNGRLLEPRMRIGTAPYAFRAGDANTLGGLAASAFAAAQHSHDAAYYPRAEADEKFASMADVGSAVDAVAVKVANETSAREAAINTVAASVTAEKTARESALTALAASVASNHFTKSEADARYVSVDAPVGGGGALLGSWEFDENSGSNFADGSGNKIVLLAPFGGQSAGSLGHSGNAVNFSGGVLAAGAPNELRDAPYVTLEAWVRPATALTGKQTIAHREGVFRLTQDNGKLVFQVTAAKGSCTVTHSASTKVGAWSHVSGYYNGREIAVQLDEVVAADTCANGPLAAANGKNFFVGAEGTQRAESYVGFIDELRLWAVAPMTRLGAYASTQAIPTCSEQTRGLTYLDGLVFRGCDGANWQIIGGDTSAVTWTFSNCGQTGRTGPTQAMCDGAYTGSTLAGKVTLASGIQNWTVPETGRYRITTWGAEGSEGTYEQGQHEVGQGGKGAKMSGVFSLTKDTVLKILVGQAGTTGTAYGHQPGGGGGGTFVTKSDNTPLIIAGGGGGGGDYAYGQSEGGHGRIVTSGETVVAHTSYVSTGGANGQGGTQNGNVNYSGCGAGLLGNGGARGNIAAYPQAFVNGGTGGQASSHSTGSVGGFGGGGHGELCGGGGGGYSGGGATCGWSSYGRAGGGGSYNAGTHQQNEMGANFGHGKVEIVFLR